MRYQVGYVPKEENCKEEGRRIKIREGKALKNLGYVPRDQKSMQGTKNQQRTSSRKGSPIAEGEGNIPVGGQDSQTSRLARSCSAPRVTTGTWGKKRVVSSSERGRRSGEEERGEG